MDMEKANKEGLSESNKRFIIQMISRLTDPKTQIRRKEFIVIMGTSVWDKFPKADLKWMELFNVPAIAISGNFPRDRIGYSIMDRSDFFALSGNDDYIKTIKKSDKELYYSSIGHSLDSVSSIIINFPSYEISNDGSTPDGSTPTKVVFKHKIK